MGRPAGSEWHAESHQSGNLRSELHVGGDLDESYVQDLARYVGEKMIAVAAATQTVDSMRVAVLAAMAIADELHTLRQEKGDRDENLREHTEQCLTILLERPPALRSEANSCLICTGADSAKWHHFKPSTT
jgi:cell division protein ZapA (FtsZ GTPase activity inhibitor)